MKKFINKYKQLFVVTALCLFIGGGVVSNTNPQADIFLNAQSEDTEIAEGEYYIDQDINENYKGKKVSYQLFEAGVEGTGGVEVRANWTISQNNNHHRTAIISGCENTTSCDVYYGLYDETAELTATAVADNQVSISETIQADNLDNNYFSGDEVPTWMLAEGIALAEREIMTGYEDGSFGANDKVTRGQVIVMLVRLMDFLNLTDSDNYSVADCRSFSNLANDHYAYDAICFAADSGWIDDFITSNNQINADKPMQRIEIAELLRDAILKSYAEEKNFSSRWLKNRADVIFADVDSDSLFAETIGINQVFGIFGGELVEDYQNNQEDDHRDRYLFNGTRELNRAETAVVFWRLYRVILRTENISVVE